MHVHADGSEDQWRAITAITNLWNPLDSSSTSTDMNDQIDQVASAITCNNEMHNKCSGALQGEMHKRYERRRQARTKSGRTCQ